MLANDKILVSLAPSKSLLLKTLDKDKMCDLCVCVCCVLCFNQRTESQRDECKPQTAPT